MSLEVNNFRIKPFASLTAMASSVYNKDTILISVNALTLLSGDADLQRLCNKHTGYIDGVGAWLVARQLKSDVGTRIAGADLWLELLRYKPDARVYCVGSTSEIISTVVKKLKVEFPLLTICGYRDGFLNSEQDEDHLLADLKRTQPEYIFIAMGQPRQELLAARLFQAYPALYAGLGGSFDVYSGKLNRAPQWIQRLGMEWLYRLVQEPSRWRRMLPLVKLLPLLLKPGKH